MGFRVDRTSEDLKRELTDIIRHVKDPRVSSILTIIKVDLSNDMSHCKVYVSSLEGMEKAKEAAEEPPKAARKRYPRQKAPKNLSTDQFIERERERNRQNAGAVDSEE